MISEYTIKDIEYEIVDEPYLGYEVHLCKLSAGWRPLLQSISISLALPYADYDCTLF